MDVWAICQAAADQLVAAGVVGVSGWAPDAVDPPCVIVGHPTVNFDLVMRGGLHELTIPLHLFTSRAIDKTGQQQLAGLIGTGDGTVKSALEQYRSDGSDPPGSNLGVSDLLVKQFAPHGVEEYAAYQMFGGLFTCQAFVED